VGILAYYAVLMGWTGPSLLEALLRELPADMAAAQAHFAGIIYGGPAVLGQVLSMGLTGLVVAAGIRTGIERLTSWGVPLLFVLLLALAIWASFLPGAQEGYQAFFSIGAGIGCILAYAAYLDQRSAQPREAVSVVGLDTAVGLMAGCGSSPRLQRLLLLALRWIRHWRLRWAWLCR